MPFEAYLTAKYEHPHENEMFAALVAALMAKFKADPAPHILIGNIMFEGNDLDAIYLKPSGIAVIEMKGHGGKVTFHESTPWKVGNSDVVGGTRPNPFRQVRDYRRGVSNFLVNRENEILGAQRQVRWDQVSGVVLFGKPIEFDEYVLGGLRVWFKVTDMARIADHLASIRKDALQLDGSEIRKILKLVGLDGKFLYQSSTLPTGTPVQASPPEVLKPLQVVYLKDFAFRERREVVGNRGGAQSQAAQRVAELLEQVRQGLNPFKAIPSRADARVQGAAIYTINTTTELLLIGNEVSIYPAFVGAPSEVQGWLAANEGLVVAVDGGTGRISVTRMLGKVDTEKMQSPALTTDTRSLLTQVPNLNLEEMIPSRKIREALLELDQTSPQEEIKDTLEMVADEDLRTFLFELIDLVRAGNHAGAESRLRLRLGINMPVEDAGKFGQDAAASDANSDQALVINALSKEELDRLLDPKHFQDWMLFLHPDQKIMAESEFDRPTVLTGVSGSGKTCILVHRARHLAKKYPGEKIGILTLSRTLAGLLQNLVNQLLTGEERKNVEVRAFYDVFRDCLKIIGPEKYFGQLAEQLDGDSHMHTVLRQAHEKWPDHMVWDCDPIRNDTVEEQWPYFYMSQNPDVREWMDELVKYLEDYRLDASRYLEEEFTLIRSSFAVPNRFDYLNTADERIRAGRCIPLSKDLRNDALHLLLFWEEWLLAGGMIDNLGLTQALMPLHKEMQSLPERNRYRCLLVDEFQDFSTLDLQLLRRIVPVDKPDALFLAGDTVQKILVKKLSMGGAALDRGPAIHKSIRKNYRNSKQVLRAASRLANHFGALAKSQGEEIEVLDPELAQRESNPPIVLKTDDQIAKAWEIALECTQNQANEPWTVCIATASPQKLSVEKILRDRPNQLQACQLSGDCILHPEQVVVGTIHDLKGFEFRLILIIGCDAKAFPETGIPHDEVWRDALRLYVAMTRGRDQVYLLHGDSPSEFVTVFADTVITREEPSFKTYEKVKPIAQVTTTHNGNPRIKIAPSTKNWDWDENCEKWFDPEETEALKRYFAIHVYRDNLTFHEWMVPSNLRRLNHRALYNLKRVRGNIAAHIINKLRQKGVIK
jgi:hypothetical protein